MRFRARRIGPYNEYLYTFFKCLAPDRLMYAEGWYAARSAGIFPRLAVACPRLTRTTAVPCLRRML